MLPSILGDGSAKNDFGFVRFTPGGALKFGQLWNLSSVYDFTIGDCHSGALRWSGRIGQDENGLADGTDGSVFIYYSIPRSSGTVAWAAATTATTRTV